MSFRERYNSPVVGIISGLILPVIAGLIFYLVTAKGLTIAEYYRKTMTIGNLTQIVSVSVFTNIIIFLVFNRLDMLNASKGVLGITIAWALLVFGIKLL